METTGAFSRYMDRALRALAVTARAPDVHDSTRYGMARGSPKSFYAHHAAVISATIARHEANTLNNAASSVTFSLLA